MIIQIKLGRPVEPVGDIATFTVETNNTFFIKEVQKFVCPVRLMQFLDIQMKNNYDIKELIMDKDIANANIDITIDLLSKTDEIMSNQDKFFEFDEYLEDTEDYLDEYGNPKELSDLTEHSDRGYEMNLDSELYK